MPARIELSRTAPWARLVTASLFALGTAACSGDVSRLSENSLSNPYASQNASRIDAAPLPQVQDAGHAPSSTANATNSTMAAHSLARHRGASAEATGAVPAHTMASAEPAGDGSARIHVIAPGETLMQLSRIYQKSLSEIARANNIAPSTRVKVGDRIAIPGAGGHVGIAAAVPPADARIASPPMQRIAAVEPPQTTRVATASVMPEPEPVTKLAEPAGAMPSFRWPVRARVIAGFGPKPNGLQNDGINLAVPEGTPIKSAEDGVVAYAGNELKGYGNLVLVRHAHGFVTAYAHASEILVKRGDQVKRGQVIVKSGQTGNVSSPQLHFEIRKGSTPVDPTQFLNGA